MAQQLLFPPIVKNPREMLAAGVGGVMATGVDIAMLVLLVERVGLSIPASAFLASSLGAVVCFLMNKHVAFRDRSPVTAVQIIRFGLVAVSTSVLMAYAMQIVAVDLGVPYVVAKLVCAIAVFIAWTYPAQRRLVFRVGRRRISASI